MAVCFQVHVFEWQLMCTVGIVGNNFLVISYLFHVFCTLPYLVLSNISFDQAALRTRLSVCPYVCLSHIFRYVPLIVSSWNFLEILPWQIWCPCKESWSNAKVQGHRGQNKFCPNLGVSGPWLHFLQMATKRCTKLEVAQKRSSIVFWGNPSNFMVTWDQKPSILSQTGHFRIVNPQLDVA